MTFTRTADVAVIIHNTYVYILYIYIGPLLNNITTKHTLYEIVT